MTKLTKEEQIQAIYDLKVGYTLGHADIAMLKAMARQLLAGMEQEPYGYVHKEVYEAERSCGLSSDHEAHRDSLTHIPLYAAPQLPQPAVPDALDDYVNSDEHPLLWSHNKGWNACRAAMLGAEPVQGWIPCSERMPEFDTSVLLYFPDYGGHIESGCIGDEGDGPYHYFFDGDSLRYEPTHWMPLPAAPQQEVK